MADLGVAPSLADRLLGSSAAAADRALLDWVFALGRLAATTRGREAELTALLPALGLAPPPGLQDDLDKVLAATAPQRYPVFSPGDICPDNTLLTGHGLQLVDFEGAGYHSVFLDAAYLRMPFATCWCVFRLLAELAGTSDLPALAGLLRLLLAATGDWAVAQLPLYPAYR